MNLPGWAWLLVAMLIFFVLVLTLGYINSKWRGPNEDPQIDAPPPVKIHPIEQQVEDKWANEPITGDEWWR